jgi:hypothetical protein
MSQGFKSGERAGDKTGQLRPIEEAIDQWRLVTFLAGWADILMLLLHFLLCLL